MIETSKIIETAARQAAVIYISTPRSEMPAVFGPAVEELMNALAMQGVERQDRSSRIIRT